MRLLVACLLSLALLLPARAQEADIARLLGQGDYPAAEKRLQAALEKDPGNPTLARFMAATQLGLGRTGVALAQAEALEPRDDLKNATLTLMASYLDARPRRIQLHMPRVLALADRSPGPYADFARFVVLSLQHDLDLSRAGLTDDEIARRHREAWALIGDLQYDPALTYEPLWLADLYNHAWLTTIHLTRPERATEVFRAAGLLEDPSTVVQVGERFLAGGSPAMLLAGLSLYANLGTIYLVSNDLAASEKAVQFVDSRLPDPPDPGFASGVKAYVGLLKLSQAFIRAQSQPDPALMGRLGDQASRFSYRSGNLEVIMNVATTRVNYLMSARPAGWEEAARKLLEEAFDQPGFFAVRRNQIHGWYYQGMLLSGAPAVECYRKAVDALEAFLGELEGGNKALLRGEFAGLYEALAREQLKLGQSPQAFETLGRQGQAEFTQTFSLEDFKQRLPTTDRQLVTRAQEAKEQVAARESQLTALKASQAPSEVVTRASRLLADSRESYYACITELEKKDPAFTRLDIKPVNFFKLQRVIPADTLVLQLFPSEDRLYLLGVTREKLVVREVAVSRAELDELVRSVRTQLLEFSRHPGPFDWSSKQGVALRELLARLGELLIDPAAPEMADKKVLAVIPYGNLMYLPFASLVTGSSRFLIEDRQIVVLTKATDLDQIYGPPSVTTGSLVAFGNPDGTLPGASEEVAALRALFPRARIYLEGQATGDKLAGVQAPEISFLHLATHGTLDSKDTRASYLTLAQGQRLTVTDIMAQHLESGGEDMALVTLSACQTALAERNPDGSDLRTLADAFSLAGSRSLVASLWKVSDDSTRDLMVAFYRGLKAGKPKAQALQEAKLELLRDPRYRHPFYWAPFILIGDWR